MAQRRFEISTDFPFANVGFRCHNHCVKRLKRIVRRVGKTTQQVFAIFERNLVYSPLNPIQELP